MGLTKANKTNAIPAIIEIAERSTKPFSAVKMAQKLRKYQSNFTFSDDVIYGWLSELECLRSVGIITENGEQYEGFELDRKSKEA